MNRKESTVFTPKPLVDTKVWFTWMSLEFAAHRLKKNEKRNHLQNTETPQIVINRSDCTAHLCPLVILQRDRTSAEADSLHTSIFVIISHVLYCTCLHTHTVTLHHLPPLMMASWHGENGTEATPPTNTNEILLGGELLCMLQCSADECPCIVWNPWSAAPSAYPVFQRGKHCINRAS